MCPKLIELLSWNGPTVHVCCFMLVRASTKTFVIRISIRQPNLYSLAESKKQRKKSSLVEKFVSRVTPQPRYRCTTTICTCQHFPFLNYIKKVKCTLVQALRLCTGRMAHRGSRGIALLFFDHGTRKGVRGQLHAPAALYPRERPGTHCTGGWVGPRAGLHRCGKSRPHRDSIPGPSRPQPVAIPTILLNYIVREYYFI